jgi:selenocysteine lyase/cysteine desulfurase
MPAFPGVRGRSGAYIEKSPFLATKPDHQPLPQRLYLDHAATTPLLPAARAAMAEGLARWANPSSPHAEGRAARAALERARDDIRTALGSQHDLIFTSGASEAIAIALQRTAAAGVCVSAVEHDAVLRAAPGAPRLAVDADGRVGTAPAEAGGSALFAVQHVNNETGVIQDRPAADGWWFADCAQSAGKIPLPDADLIAISAHKLGGPPGIGALLVRDAAMIRPSGGQERGYRGGTENGGSGCDDAVDGAGRGVAGAAGSGRGGGRRRDRSRGCPAHPDDRIVPAARRPRCIATDPAGHGGDRGVRRQRLFIRQRPAEPCARRHGLVGGRGA